MKRHLISMHHPLTKVLTHFHMSTHRLFSLVKLSALICVNLWNIHCTNMYKPGTKQWWFPNHWDSKEAYPSFTTSCFVMCILQWGIWWKCKNYIICYEREKRRRALITQENCVNVFFFSETNSFCCGHNHFLKEQKTFHATMYCRLHGGRLHTTFLTAVKAYTPL